MMQIPKEAIPVKFEVPGATARQLTDFGDASDYSAISAEYFSLGAGTDIAPLLEGLEGDTCHAPHWGYLISGGVAVSYADSTQETVTGGELFYWPPGHSVRVTEDAEVVMFSPQSEHTLVLDHMLAKMA
jgi:hypothetical protein